MTPAATPKSDAPPSDPILAALEDPRVRADLARHSGAFLGSQRRGQAVSTREVLAEEAVQETSRRALASRDRFDALEGTIGAWLHGILINVLRELVRGSGSSPSHSPDTAGALQVLAASGVSPAEEIANRLDAATYLMRLPVEYRTILRLRLVDDLSHEEIAEQLGISVPASRVRFHRAVRAAKDIAGVTPEEGGR